jgi:hypothetical protein
MNRRCGPTVHEPVHGTVFCEAAPPVERWQPFDPEWQGACCKHRESASSPPVAMTKTIENNGASGEIMSLSDDAQLIFTLQSGVSGRLKAGRVERDGDSVINVFDQYGGLQAYFSGAKLRSWCIVGPTGLPIPSWSSILPEDRGRLLPNASNSTARPASSHTSILL